MYGFGIGSIDFTMEEGEKSCTISFFLQSEKVEDVRFPDFHPDFSSNDQIGLISVKKIASKTHS